MKRALRRSTLRPRGVRLAVLAIAALALATLAVAAGLLAAQRLDAGRPAWLVIEPNAIQKLDEPMWIEVGGVPQGQSVILRILQDCDGDHKPDLHGQGGCRSPLFERASSRAEVGNVVRDRLDLLAVERAGSPLPKGQPLWLMASRQGAKEGVGTLALFGIADNPCSLWRSALETFHLGACSPAAAGQSLRHHLGPLMNLAAKLFEVRRLVSPEGASTVTAVPGTLGATGVSWRDDATLLVTTVSAEGGAAGKAEQVRTALRSVPLGGGEAAVLWSASWSTAGAPGLPAAAPLALPGGRVAFVRQRLWGGEPASGEPAAVLSIWSEGKLDPASDLPLDLPIHQLLASSADGRSIFGLTLGPGDSQPAFLEIDLAARTVQNLGFSNALYQAAMRSPRLPVSVISFEDNSGRQGWDLVLVGPQGQWLKDLQARAEDDLAPVWRPDGAEIAYLAEVERARRAP